jgi:hypothetical protein
MVHGSTGRGVVYHCPNLLELIDGSTSSCVAMDYHRVTYLDYDPCGSCVCIVRFAMRNIGRGGNGYVCGIQMKVRIVKLYENVRL